MATSWGVLRCVAHRALDNAGSMLLSNASAEACVEKRDMQSPRSGSDDTVLGDFRGVGKVLSEWLVSLRAKSKLKANEGKVKVRSRDEAM